VNKEELKKNKSAVGKLQPAAKDEEGQSCDDDWRIEELDEERIFLTNQSTGEVDGLFTAHARLPCLIVLIFELFAGSHFEHL
jgi:hypothetical protein